MHKDAKNWMNRICRLLCMIAVVFPVLSMYISIHVPSVSALQNYIDYQGRLTDQNGNLLTGNYYITFCLYTTSSPATNCTPPTSPAQGAIGTLSGSVLHSAVWGEVQYFSNSNSPDNHVTNGVFNAHLGTQSSLTTPTDIFSAESDLYLGLNVWNGSSWDGQTTPLQEIVSAGYSIDAGALVAGSTAYTGSQTPGNNQVPITDSSGNITLTGNLNVGSGKQVASSAALTVTSGGSSALTLTSKSGTLDLGSGTNTIANTDASTALTLNPTGNLDFFSTSNALTSAGNLTLAGSITSNGTSANTFSSDINENNGNTTITPLTAPSTAPTLAVTPPQGRHRDHALDDPIGLAVCRAAFAHRATGQGVRERLHCGPPVRDALWRRLFEDQRGRTEEQDQRPAEDTRADLIPGHDPPRASARGIWFLGDRHGHAVRRDRSVHSGGHHVGACRPRRLARTSDRSRGASPGSEGSEGDRGSCRLI